MESKKHHHIYFDDHFPDEPRLAGPVPPPVLEENSLLANSSIADLLRD